MKTGMIALGRQRLERLVILVDVHVFAMQVNAKAAKAYASLIHSCVQRMLAACNEHCTGYRRSTLWAYKLFDSSLSPLASRSKLDRLLDKQQPHLVRFSTSEGNLSIFQQGLQKVAVGLCGKGFGDCQQGKGKLDSVVCALQELFSDFMWGPLFLSDSSSSDEDLGRQKRSNGPGWNPLQIRGNVVILFSHLPTLTKSFANFVDTSNPQDSGADQDLLRDFSRKLQFLQEPFRLHNIHTCWIDIPVSTSTLPLQGQELPVSSDLEQRVDRCSIHSEFAAARWSFMALETFAIASDSIPNSMLWSSIAYPAPPVGPSASKMFAKLRIVVQGRNAVKLQPEVCRVVVVPLVPNYSDTRLMKENALHPLSKGTSFVKSIFNNLQDSQVFPSAKVKIVLKSLVPKQDVVLKIGLKRYLVYHHAGVGTISKKERDTDSAQDESLRECRFQVNDSNHNYGDEIFQQLQQQSMQYEPGEPAWQLLLIAIGRTKSVAKVDLYQDGLCISAFLEPITVHYAVLMQEDQGSKSASSESLMLQRQSLRAFHASGPLATINEEDENRSREPSASDECAKVKQEGWPEKRFSPLFTEQDGPAVERERLACDEGIPLPRTKYIHRSKGETYSRTKHWQFILQRGKLGTGKHQIENAYVRPGQGQRPTKVLLALKCWLDQLHVYREQQAAPQDMPSSLMLIEANTAAADETRVGEGDVSVANFDPSNRERSSSLLTEMHKRNPENGLTEEQAEACLLSIEGMVQDCLKSEDVDIQKFAKLIVKKAQEAQQVLCKRDMQRESIQAVQNDMQGETIDARCMVLTVEEGTCINQGSNTQANLHCDSRIFETEGSTKGSGEERDLVESQGVLVAYGYGAIQQLEIEETLTMDNIEMHADYKLDQSEEDLAVQNDMQGKPIDLTVEDATSISQGSSTQANLHCDSRIFETEGSTKGSGEEHDLVESPEVLVAYGYGAIRQLEIDGTLTMDNTDMHADYNLDQRDLDEAVAQQLVKKLLIKPRKLAREYKDYQSSSLLVSEGMTEGNHSVHTAEEKVRAFELQIVLRMELIVHDSGGPLKKQKKTLVKEICQLLDGILFNMIKESLHDYCNRVINDRYKNSLPKTVADIFDMMEFNGYTEPVSCSQLVLCSPGADTEDYCELTTQKGENIQLQGEANKLDITNQSAAAKKSRKLKSGRSKRSKRQGLTTEGIIKQRNKVPAFTNELTKANEKRELARRLTHFGGPDSHHKLKKVTLHNQIQSKPPRLSSSSGRDVILETPMVDRHQPLPETPMAPDLDDQVESLCARVVMSSGRFGFRTPARSRPHKTTSRKKRLVLGSHKKPVGRGLPRIALEAMRSMKARKELQRALDNGVQEQSYQPAGQFEQPELPCSRKRMSPDPDRQGQYEGGIVKGSAREVPAPLSENASRLLTQGMQNDSEALKHDLLLDSTSYKRRDAFNLSYGLPHSPGAASTSEIWSPLPRECSMPVTAAQAVDTWDDIGLNIRENLEINMTRLDSENRRKSPRISALNEEVLPLFSSLGSEAAVPAATSCPASAHFESEIRVPETLEVKVASLVEDGEIVDLKTRGSVRQKRRKSSRTSKLNKIVATEATVPERTQTLDDTLSEHNRKDSPLILCTVVTKIQQQSMFQATPESNDDLALLELCCSGNPEPRLKPEARLSTSYHRAHKRKRVGLVPEDGELQGGMLEDGGKENCSPILKRKIRGAREESPGQYAIRKQEPSRKKKSRSATCSPQ